MPYRIEISPAAGRDLRRLATVNRKRLEPTILALADNPRPDGVRKIRGQDHSYRVRQGDYRIIHDVYDDKSLVVILRVDRRSESTYHRI